MSGPARGMIVLHLVVSLAGPLTYFIENANDQRGKNVCRFYMSGQTMSLRQELLAKRNHWIHGASRPVNPSLRFLSRKKLQVPEELLVPARSISIAISREHRTAIYYTAFVNCMYRRGGKKSTLVNVLLSSLCAVDHVVIFCLAPFL